ncbi:hypothetical protein EOPP23_16450 [Endozoicomonas sp. OPT23]|uniref:globin domain-containing protein n=1 Tax=Endozoicomonas sp. OPT23 TaxID=2072845 RepID=UPI00129AF755|nr:globin domain-containing protein [Endozoicomonas sp. OPT23]MRI34577.1 hypothetical protein [Endozoicomonas sp. OPT23]
MLERHLQVIESSIKSAIEKDGIEKLSSRLFDRLFDYYPETKSLFDISSIPVLAPRKFQLLLDLIVDTLKHPGYAESAVADEAIRHSIYDLKHKEYYFILMETVPLCLKHSLKEVWTAETEECWNDTVSGLKGLFHKAILEHEL